MIGDHNKIAKNRFLLLLILLMLPALPAAAMSGGPYDLSWNSIDGGGQTSAGGAYTLTGTIGQADAGYNMKEPYTQSGGFWSAPLCEVTLDDLVLFAYGWMDPGPQAFADLDGSGTVDLADFAEVAAHWLSYCPAGWPF
jgi:hypothetical protein